MLRHASGIQGSEKRRRNIEHIKEGEISHGTFIAIL
jgi:hypothetical protein